MAIEWFLAIVGSLAFTVGAHLRWRSPHPSPDRFLWTIGFVTAGYAGPQAAGLMAAHPAFGVGWGAIIGGAGLAMGILTKGRRPVMERMGILAGSILTLVLASGQLGLSVQAMANLIVWTSFPLTALVIHGSHGLLQGPNRGWLRRLPLAILLLFGALGVVLIQGPPTTTYQGAPLALQASLVAIAAMLALALTPPLSLLGLRRPGPSLGPAAIALGALAASLVGLPFLPAVALALAFAAKSFHLGIALFAGTLVGTLAAADLSGYGPLAIGLVALVLVLRPSLRPREVPA